MLILVQIENEYATSYWLSMVTLSSKSKWIWLSICPVLDTARFFCYSTRILGYSPWTRSPMFNVGVPRSEDPKLIILSVITFEVTQPVTTNHQRHR